MTRDREALGGGGPARRPTHTGPCPSVDDSVPGPSPARPSRSVP